MARARRRACYSVASSIKDIVGESFIEDDADDQQKGDRNAMSMSDSKQKYPKIDTKFERPTETDSKETHTHTQTHKQRYRHRRTHTHTVHRQTPHPHTQTEHKEEDTYRHTHRHRHTRTQRGRHIKAHTHRHRHTRTQRDRHGLTNRDADRHQDTHTNSQRSHRCRGHLGNLNGGEVRDLNMLLRNASRSRQLYRKYAKAIIGLVHRRLCTRKS